MIRSVTMARAIAAAPLLPAGAERADAGAPFRAQFGDAFLDRYRALQPDAAIAVGYYRYASRIAVPDANYRARRLAFLERSIAALRRLPEAGTDAATRTDRAVLLSQLEQERWSLAEFREWQWNPALHNVADAFALLLNTPYAPEAERLRSVSKRLTQVPAYYAAARAAIERPVREQVQLAVQQSQGTLDGFGDDLERQVAGSALDAAERALPAAAARRAWRGRRLHRFSPGARRRRPRLPRRPRCLRAAVRLHDPDRRHAGRAVCARPAGIRSACTRAWPSWPTACGRSISRIRRRRPGASRASAS